MKRFVLRLERLEARAPKAQLDTPDRRRTWCVANGFSPDSVVLGLGGSLLIVLPPESD